MCESPKGVSAAVAQSSPVAAKEIPRASLSSDVISFTATLQRRSAVSSSLAESWTAEYALAKRSRAPRTWKDPAARAMMSANGGEQIGARPLGPATARRQEVL